MLCVVKWFQGQEGPSSCPYCRHESGTLDNVPMAEDDEDEDEDEEEDDDEEDEEEDNDIDVVWFRTADGTWVRHWREAAEPQQWKPTSVEPPPEGLTRTATQIQTIWRGHSIRADMAAAGMLLSLKTEVLLTK